MTRGIDGKYHNSGRGTTSAPSCSRSCGAAAGSAGCRTRTRTRPGSIIPSAHDASGCSPRTSRRSASISRTAASFTAPTHAAARTNFHMKPNGVFWIGDGVAGVTETGRYLANPPAARYATQSGPMLIVDGRSIRRSGRRHLGKDPQRRRRLRGRRDRLRHRRRTGDLRRVRAPLPRRARLSRTRSSSTARCPRSTRRNSSATTNSSRSDRSSGWCGPPRSAATRLKTR